MTLPLLAPGRAQAPAPAGGEAYWPALARSLGLRSGALSGRPDQSLLIAADRLPRLLEALAHQVRAGAVRCRYFVPGQPLRELRGAAQAQWALSAASDFVVELDGAAAPEAAAHVFVYDRRRDGNCVVRSKRAHVRRFRSEALEAIYPAPDSGAADAEPIDVVYTWVDSGDPAWQQLWRRCFPAAEPDPDRYAANDELPMSLRSLAKYAPWVRRVYVVSNCARPAAIASGAPLVWVDHASVFPDPACLPTFNSHAIEACLHRIDGLAERFLYFNDDFVLNRPCYPHDFYDAQGRSRCFLEPWGMVDEQAYGDDAPDFLLAARNGSRLLGGGARQLLQHAPYALRRSLLAELERRYGAAFRRTREARLRSAGDISVPSFLYHHAALREGQAVPAEPAIGQLTPGNIAELLAPARETACQFLCFNDGKQSAGDARYKARSRAYFVDRFGRPSRYERAAAAPEAAG